MNFKIVNNNDSDIHININNNSNILNKNKSTISEDNEKDKELYSEEEYSEELKESVKEIKENKIMTENDIYNINKEIDFLKGKINIIKDDMLALIGGTDYNYIINLYNSANNNNSKVDAIYEKIETFVNKYYDQEKRENFNNLYYLLISFDYKLAKKQNEIKYI